MKKLLLIFLILFSEVNSKEITISCWWEEKVFFNKDKIITKKQNLSENEFFYINTKFQFFGDPRNYSFLSDPNNEFNKNDIFEFKNNIFFILSDLSGGTRTHYFTSTYNLKSGRIVDEFVNLNPNYGKIQSTKKYGSCEEVIFQNCEDEQILICSGNYENLNKITKEKIKYKKKKQFFLCKQKKILSEKPFSKLQRIFPDRFEDNKYQETKLFYNVALQNTEGNDFHLIKLNKKNLKIEESIDLFRINTTFSGNCIIQK